MKLKLDSDQIKARDFMLKNPYSICAMSMGMGKSAVSLDVWEKTGGNLLIICPSYLKINWRDEIRKCIGNEPIIDLFTSGKEIYEIFDTDVAIISYDLAQRAEHLFSWADTVILDEGQYLASLAAKRTEFIHRCVYENSLKRVHILTGTPIKNRVKEFYSLLSLMHYEPDCNQKFLKKFPDEISFADYFSHRSDFTMEIKTKRGPRWVTVTKWEGFQHVDELKSHMKGRYIRFKLRAAPPRFKDILVSESPDKKLLEAFERHFEEDGKDSVASNIKAEASLKMVPFTVRYVEDLLAEGVKCVPIYTDHIETCKALAQKFGVPALTGKMGANARARAAKAFQSGEGKILCATIGALSTGVDLTRANNLVFNDPPWVPGLMDQVIGRVNRRTQTKMVLIHRMQGSPQAKKIYEALDSKRQTIAAVT